MPRPPGRGIRRHIRSIGDRLADAPRSVVSSAQKKEQAPRRCCLVGPPPVSGVWIRVSHLGPELQLDYGPENQMVIPSSLSDPFGVVRNRICCAFFFGEFNEYVASAQLVALAGN